MSTSFPDVTDPVAQMLGQQIEQGIAAIVEANETLLANEDSSTGVREIDKELKTYIPSEENDVSDKDEEIVKAVAQLEKARKAFKTAQEKARNLYRTNVLHEDEVVESDTDEDALKEQVKAKRKLVMEAVTLLSSYAESNNLSDVSSWAKNLSIPQVGRQGASTVGQKKPRAYVSVNGTVHDSFGKAADAATALINQGVEDKSQHVEVTSPDLVQAWVENGEKEEFTYQGLTVRVTPKETKSKAA